MQDRRDLRVARATVVLDHVAKLDARASWAFARADRSIHLRSILARSANPRPPMISPIP